MAWSSLLWVFLGGGVGACLRYGVSVLLAASHTNWPWSTLIVNLLGCTLAGWLAARFGLSDAAHPWRALVMVGLLGGFTTFSAFGLETIMLLQRGHVLSAMSYVLLSVLGGLLGVYLGFAWASH
jgi:fluoride exporter